MYAAPRSADRQGPELTPGESNGCIGLNVSDLTSVSTMTSHSSGYTTADEDAVFDDQRSVDTEQSGRC